MSNPNCKEFCPAIAADFNAAVAPMQRARDAMVQMVGDGEGIALTPARFQKLIEDTPIDPRDFSNAEEFAQAATKDAIARMRQIADDPETLKQTGEMLEELDLKIGGAQMLHDARADVIAENCPGKLRLKGGGFCVTICQSPMMTHRVAPVPSFVNPAE